MSSVGALHQHDYVARQSALVDVGLYDHAEGRQGGTNRHRLDAARNLIGLRVALPGRTRHRTTCHAFAAVVVRTGRPTTGRGFDFMPLTPIHRANASRLPPAAHGSSRASTPARAPGVPTVAHSRHVVTHHVAAAAATHRPARSNTICHYSGRYRGLPRARTLFINRDGGCSRILTGALRSHGFRRHQRL